MHSTGLRGAQSPVVLRKSSWEPLLLWARPGAQSFHARGAWSLALRDCLFPSGCLLGLTPAERPGRCQEYSLCFRSGGGWNLNLEFCQTLELVLFRFWNLGG